MYYCFIKYRLGRLKQACNFLLRAKDLDCNSSQTFLTLELKVAAVRSIRLTPRNDSSLLYLQTVHYIDITGITDSSLSLFWLVSPRLNAKAKCVMASSPSNEMQDLWNRA